MSFLESPIFPEKVSFGITGGPGYSTRVVRTIAGNEFRDQLLEQALHSYEASHVAKRPGYWEPLRAFFHIAGGRLNGFRFKDWSDFTVVSGEGAFAQLSTLEFQMYKVYTVDASVRNRRIQKPRPNAIITGGTVDDYDTTTGIVTMTSGTPTGWTGEFDVPCRFDVDQMKGEIIDKAPTGAFFQSWSNIPIIEIRI